MKMSFQSAIDYIHDNPEIYLQRDKSRTSKGFICPVCNSGSGAGKDKKGTGITTKDGIHYRCWASDCFYNSATGNHTADIIDIIGKAEKLDNKEALKKAFEIYNIEVDYSIKDNYKKPEKKKEEPAQEVDHTAYYNECSRNLYENWDRYKYLEKRGLSKDTCIKYWLGIEEHFKTQNKATGEYEEWQAIIIPTGKGTYTVRNTDIEADKENRYRNRGSASLFNAKAIGKTDAPLFVTEGELDSLSIIEAGGQAVALGSTSNWDKFLDQIKKTNTKQPIILLMDNDEKGQSCQQKIKEGLAELNVKQYEINVCGEYKDSNDALRFDRDNFIKKIKGITADLDMWKELEKKRTTNAVVSFMREIDYNATAPSISTGYKEIDRILDGGLMPELYIVQAGTGTGKTFFLQNIADNIAMKGHKVFFYNLEMSTNEMIARSISRLSAFNVLQGFGKGNTRLILPARDITLGRRYDENLGKYVTFTKDEAELLAKSFNDYAEFCDNITYFETLGYVDTKDIIRQVDYHVRVYGEAPVVFLDYLQMLALGIGVNSKKSLTERQCVDSALLDLKQISRKYHCPVIAISSINRDAQKSNKEIQLESGKESGAIEFTAGISLGLDFEEKEKEEFDKKAEMRRDDGRRMKLRTMKNRHGKPEREALLTLYPQYSLYKERSR